MGILEEILENKREELASSKAKLSPAELRSRCEGLPPARKLEPALRPPDPGRVKLIAELKKASPSRGVLSDSFDPLGLARIYARNGAAALSVLTDQRYFQGQIGLLAGIRAAVGVPLLRKDFILDEYQLWESRAAGADAILLIVAALEPTKLKDLLHAAKGIGLGTLVEAHSRAEMDSALSLGAPVIGINNRDLRTFETRIETSLDLIPLIPPGPVVVSESGFYTRLDVERVVAAGAHAVLVGEALVTAADVAAKVRELALL
jgi:indole-3-glycerol phosphate synthase